MNIARHLTELSHLTKRQVTEAELLSLEQTRDLRERSASAPKASQKFQIPFAERGSTRFLELIRAAYDRNPGPIYLWTEGAISCGVLKLGSILHFNTAFDFGIERNGVISLVSEDLGSRIVLDFYEEDGEQILEVELAGSEWGDLRY